VQCASWLGTTALVAEVIAFANAAQQNLGAQDAPTPRILISLSGLRWEGPLPVPF
jgi:hypothetical protein